MKRKRLYWMTRYTLIILGTLIFFNALAVSMASNFNLGIVLTYLIGGALLLAGLFFPVLIRRCPRWLWIAFLCAMALVILCSAVLLIYGRVDTVTYDEDIIIVLGAGIHGERLSLTLRERLNAAVNYFERNPNVLIVVSGGQGPQEDISEALAMERYLIERGVPPENIIKEDRSTSTSENFLFSKEILDSQFGSDLYRVAYITNDFHVFRSEQIAHRAGIENIHHLHSNTVWYLLLPSCLRECLAVVWYWITGR